MGNFQNDLLQAHEFEELAVKLYMHEHPNLHRKKEKEKGFDLIADDGYTAEVKHDKLSEKTNRVGIEFECYKKPSGIEATTAKEWIHFYKLLGNLVVSKIKVSDLKNFINSNKQYLEIGIGGDNRASFMYLINVYDFADSFGFNVISST